MRDPLTFEDVNAGTGNNQLLKATLRHTRLPNRRDLPPDELYLTIGNVMTRSGHCRDWVMARILDGRIPSIKCSHGRARYVYLIPESAYMRYAYSIQKENH